jgi:hypothetical protein
VAAVINVVLLLLLPCVHAIFLEYLLFIEDL